MIQATSMNCTPIKPTSFKGTDKTATLSASADLLNSFEEDGLTENNFNNLKDISEDLHDGPLKTFAKIAGIAGGAAIAAKLTTAKLLTKITKSKTIQNNVAQPAVKSLSKALSTAKNNIAKSKHLGEKTVKGFFVNNTNKFLNWLDKYGQTGVEDTIKNIDKDMNKIANATKASIKASAKKNNKVLSEDQLKQLLKEKLSGNTDSAKKYQALAEQRATVPTDNIIKKTTGNVIATGTGVTAVVEANKDKDGNGVADIAQHKSSDKNNDFED